ncbi:MAG: hypothetical protein GW834_15010 [Cyanobacteria bacterium]|nr:hypothetical protein [Cyanobacteria bacterium CG_2015-09_32_10]
MNSPQSMIKRISFALLVVFYFTAGMNHFRDPEFYLKLIPPYLPYHNWINILAGIVEIGFSILLINVKTRNWAVYGIVAMLIAFIPSHIYAVGLDEFWFGSVLVPNSIIWARLLIIHPLLIIWVYLHKVPKKN